MTNRRVLWNYASDNAHDALNERKQFVQALRLHRPTLVDEIASSAVFCELITNVVRHSPGPIRISVYSEDGTDVFLRVEDDGTMFSLNPNLPQNVTDEGGRGLYIASHYARELRIENNPAGGKAMVAILLQTERPIGSKENDMDDFL
jgi:anti-sigma regulatory factor (Ser/Thr protein kinase)